MTTDASVLLTARQCADELDVDLWVFNAAVSAAGIEPVARAAAVRLFGRDQLPLMRKVLDARAASGAGRPRSRGNRRVEVAHA